MSAVTSDRVPAIRDDALLRATRRRHLISRLTAHAALVLGVVIFVFPIYLALIGSTHDVGTVGRGDMPLTPGPHLLDNYAQALNTGGTQINVAPAGLMLWNSLLMATLIASGKIVISILSAYAVVFFRFPLRMAAFWAIFITLMLPVEVRIIPTFQVIVDLRLNNTMLGLTVPLIASATATLLFRQFFLTIPALFVILFIYGWNQYLWPLLIVNDRSLETIVVGLSKMIGTGDARNEWNIIMATAVLALLPPVLVVVLMQRWFVRGLTDTEK
jgi:sn-glycerol 3-phosphate transport system permease protein